MSVKIGVHYVGANDKREIAAFAGRAESLGLDSLWFREGALGGDPLVPLAAAASACDLSLGTAVLVMPFRNPIATARSLACLDELSGGRLIAGVGVGGERQREFDAYGIAAKERGPRTNEALALMLRLWQDREVDFNGRFFQAEKATLGVRPVQQPHPPLWVGGRLGGQGRSRDAALRRLARFGQGWLPYLLSPEQYATGLERLAGYAAKRGRDAASITRALQVNLAIYPSRDQALQAIMAGSARTYGLNAEQVERYYAYGTAGDVSARLRDFVAVGVEHFVFQWACRREDIDANLAALAMDVAPTLRGAV
jgi:probable F420-dependent oxidoreductase